MFRILVKSVIQVLDYLVQELKRAYSETYEGHDLSEEFNCAVKKIKEQNKKAFISAAEKFEFTKGLLSLTFPSQKEIKLKAKQHWKEALRSGDLDELYNLKERSNNE